MNKWWIRLWIIVCLSCTLSACERRLLVDVSDKVRVRVVIKTKNVLNVTTGKYNEKIPVPDILPKIIRVIFYDCDTKGIASQAFISNRGYDEEGNLYLEGDVSVLPGTYDMLCYNFDTPSTLVKDEKTWNSITAYTSEISDYLYSRTESLNERGMPPIYYKPDHLVVARERSLVIPDHSEMITIQTDASTIIDTYYIQIRLVNGKYTSNASAFLTDLSPSNKFGLNKRNNDVYSGIFFEMDRSIDPHIRSSNQEVLYAVFNTFGKRPEETRTEEESQLFVTFNVMTTYGKKVEMTIDMDSIFQTQDATKRHWLLIDKELVIPMPPDDGGDNGGSDSDDDNGGSNSGGGFKPSVDKWEKEEGYIEL